MASGMPRLAEKATMDFVDLTSKAIGKLCDNHGKALSAAYGNFDCVVACMLGSAGSSPTLSELPS